MDDVLSYLLSEPMFYIPLAIVAVLCILLYFLNNRGEMSSYYRSHDKYCKLERSYKCINGDCRKCTFAHVKYMLDHSAKKNDDVVVVEKKE